MCIQRIRSYLVVRTTFNLHPWQGQVYNIQDESWNESLGEEGKKGGSKKAEVSESSGEKLSELDHSLDDCFNL